MILDSSVQILTSPGELASNLPVSPGRTSIPRYRDDKGAFFYQLNGEEYRVSPLLEYKSELATIVNASSVPFATPSFSVDLLQELRSINPVVLCTQAQFGYTPGQWVTPSRGVSIEFTSTTIDATIFRNGVRIIRKDGTVGEVGCNVARWQLFFLATFYLPQ